MLIGSVYTSNNVFLAPMAGITDAAFRLICKEFGCGLVFTEMISAKGYCYGSSRTKEMININDNERPAAIQIFGSEPQYMSDIARVISDTNADIIDINMGCPAPKIVKSGEGSALMQDPILAGKIIRAVVSSSEKPVTVKMRKGWDDTLINAVEIASIAQSEGATAVTVHGRTREEFYTGTADWDIIMKVKEKVSIPVIGNGDIFKPQDSKRLLETTKCDGIMIGRGAQGNPWIFKRIIHYLETGELLDEPSYKERLDMVLIHMQAMIEQKGEYRAVPEMRKHIAWYLKGLKFASAVKQKVFKAKTSGEITEIIDEYVHVLDRLPFK